MPTTADGIPSPSDPQPVQPAQDPTQSRYTLRRRPPPPPPPSGTASSGGVQKRNRRSRPLKRARPMANEAAKRFFSAPYYAVAGASQDANKFGYKILSWYTAHSLPTTPLNPRLSSISLSASGSSPSSPISTLPSPSSLPHPTLTSLSVVTPPGVTLPLLREAKAAGIKAVWLQPGTYDDEVLAFMRSGFETGLAGWETGGTAKKEGEDGRGPGGGEGWCVLVDGAGAIRAAGRERGKI